MHSIGKTKTTIDAFALGNLKELFIQGLGFNKSMLLP